MKLFYVLERTGKDPLSIDIDENDTVEDLTNAIKKKHEGKWGIDHIRLYLARWKDWFSRDYMEEEKFEYLHQDLEQMNPSLRLNNLAYFGQNFTPKEKEVHVLVVFPSFSFGERDQWSFSLALNKEYGNEKYLKPYFEVAKMLKNSDEVVKLVAEIKRAPFIVLNNSSGMGKTQMAFNLMAREELDVFYLVCARFGDTPSQGVYRPFTSRSIVFQQCVKFDYDLMDEGAVDEIARHSKLFTYGFICGLLTGAESFCGRKRKEDVEEILASRQKRCVFFLDEFPLLKETNYSKVRYLRFMRNVFSVLGLPVIASSTNNTAIQLGTTDVYSRGSVDPSSLWCVVFPSLPRFQDPSIGHIPEELKRIVFNSRPLFAMEAVEYILDNPMNEEDIVEYMDKMIGKISDVFSDWKDHFPWFIAGQVCLLLCSSYMHYANNGKSNLINEHYARLTETEPFDLRINENNEIAKDGIIWKNDCEFSTMDEDILLYLVLMGGKGFRTLKNCYKNPVPFYQALSVVEYKIQVSRSENTNQLLEALITGSIVLASHKGGFSGIGFDAFFSALLYELGMKESPEDYIAFPFPVSGWRIPFLSPPNVKWPGFLPKELNLGNLETTKNDGRIGFLISDNSLSVEYRNCKDELRLEDMKTIIKQIPKQTTVHLVFIHSLQDSYVIEEDTLDDFMAHAIFYRIKETTGLEEIKGIENKRGAKKLVIFVELEDRSVIDEEMLRLLRKDFRWTRNEENGLKKSRLHIHG